MTTETQIANETDAQDVFNVPMSRMGDLKARIAKLNKRAAKIGCEPIVLTIGEPFTMVKTRDVHDGDRWTTRKEQTKCVPVTVAGSPPKYEGWTFLGTVQLIDGENIVRSVPGASIPVEYRAATDWCDHCRSSRGRKDVFVVQHDDGTTKVVGRNCIRDFLGHDSPKNIVWRATILAALRDTMGEYEGLSGASWRDIPKPIDDVLAASACAIRHLGFHKSSAEMPTKYDAGDIMAAAAGFVRTPSLDRYGNPIDWREGHPVPPSIELCDVETAEATLEWMLNIPAMTDSDYLYNLRAVAHNGTVDSRNMGLACAAVQSYLREQGLAAERRIEAEVSHHVGTVGKREVFDVTVTKVATFEGMYGYTHLHIMHDATGNVLKWSSSTYALEMGKQYKLKGTVKKHGEHKGVAQTVLSRCAIM